MSKIVRLELGRRDHALAGGFEVFAGHVRPSVALMRPGRIVEIIDIDLPRPRRLDKLPPQFNDHAGHIRDIFKSKGVPAMD